MNKTAKQLALVLCAALALGMSVTSAYAADNEGYAVAPTSGVVVNFYNGRFGKSFGQNQITIVVRLT